MTTTPTDAQMKLARECAAKAYRDADPTDALAGYVEAGEMDDDEAVQSALLAIQATEARAQGLVDAERERCARIVERRAEARFAENGTREWDTNATYYQGGMAEIYEALDEEADEIAAAIRNQHSQHGGDGKGEIECTLWKK